MRYTIFQWMLLFYFYAFLGWIWECSFVSFTEKNGSTAVFYMVHGFQSMDSAR